MRRLLLTVALTCSFALVTAPAALADPPGNNGTVKIDGVEFDDYPDNEPHVGCIFQVDWYGFDEGDYFSHVTFRIWPPVGPMEIILEDDVFIGEDDHSGGGSLQGLDASATYDLSSVLGQYQPHPNQGWHVKLTTNNEFSQGSDVKHKTFWVTGCGYPATDVQSRLSSATGQFGFEGSDDPAILRVAALALILLVASVLVTRRVLDRAGARREG